MMSATQKRSVRLNPAFAAKLRTREDRAPVPDATGSSRSHEERESTCVLVVDDEPDITRSVAELLGREYRVLTANSADEALELLRHNDVSVILTDQRMPSTTGVELLARAVDIAPETTRILFTGYSDISAVIEAVNRGQVYHYVAKPWRPDELRAVVDRGLERYRLVTENQRLLHQVQEANAQLQQANEQLEDRVRERTTQLRAQNKALREAHRRIQDLSRKDPLTGLANRRWLDEVLEREVERSQRYSLPLCAVMLDLDRFKVVNDTYGHASGDRVLQSTAQVLLDSARSVDLVGRYGGEEFLVVLPNTSRDSAAAFAERVRVRLERRRPEFRAEPVTASLGLAEWRPEESAQSLVERADRALYAAKKGGRNRVAAEP